MTAPMPHLCPRITRIGTDGKIYWRLSVSVLEFALFLLKELGALWRNVRENVFCPDLLPQCQSLKRGGKFHQCNLWEKFQRLVSDQRFSLEIPDLFWSRDLRLCVVARKLLLLFCALCAFSWQRIPFPCDWITAYRPRITHPSQLFLLSNHRRYDTNAP